MTNDQKNQPKESMLEKLFLKAKNIKLTPKEKNGIWLHIFAILPSRNWRLISAYQSLVEKRGTFLITTGLAVIILFGGGLSMAAEDALPGDIMYPIKINLNERVRALSATTPESLAKVHIDQASIRLAEAEQLAIIGRLDMGIRNDIQRRFEEHTAVAVAGTEELRSNGDIYAAASLSSELESALRAHKGAIDIIKERYDETAELLRAVDESVTRTLSTASGLRTDAEAIIISSSTNIENIKSAALLAESQAADTLSEAERSVDKHDMDSESAQAAAFDLDVAKEYRSEGISKLVSGAYGEALVLFGKAGRSAEKASLEVEIESKIKQAERINANRRGKVDVIPPLTTLPVPSVATSTAKSATSTDPAYTASTSTPDSTEPATTTLDRSL